MQRLQKISQTRQLLEKRNHLNWVNAFTKIGKDIYIKGRAKFSDYTNSYELNAFDFQEIDVDYDLEQIINEI